MVKPSKQTKKTKTSKNSSKSTPTPTSCRAVTSLNRSLSCPQRCSSARTALTVSAALQRVPAHALAVLASGAWAASSSITSTAWVERNRSQQQSWRGLLSIIINYWCLPFIIWDLEIIWLFRKASPQTKTVQNHAETHPKTILKTIQNCPKPHSKKKLLSLSKTF